MATISNVGHIERTGHLLGPGLSGPNAAHDGQHEDCVLCIHARFAASARRLGESVRAAGDAAEEAARNLSDAANLARLARITVAE